MVKENGDNMENQKIKYATTILNGVINKVENTPEHQQFIDAKDIVIPRFQEIFKNDYVENITEEEFKSFLLLENNQHWSGLHRHAPRLCSDMDLLKRSLKILIDEEKPVNERLDRSIEMVNGLGKAVTTAILLIVQPDKYGVWNGTSEQGLKKLDLWPGFDRGESFGSRYLKVNEVLKSLSNSLNVDLWTLDALWWQIPSEEDSDDSYETPLDTITGEHKFGLERHLHDFLRDNWNHTELSREWKIYSEPGDDEAGYEYPCDVGKIDLLVKGRNENKWMVIELKRDQSSDQTIGQVLRYMGWVRKHLAQSNESVEGLIIALSCDEKLNYALSEVNNVNYMSYEVEFRLIKG